jgi:Tfp pilus assembly protein PilO
MDIDIKKIYKLEFWIIALIICIFLVTDIFPMSSKAFSLLQTMNIAEQSARALPAEEKEEIRQGLLNEQKNLEDGFKSMQGVVNTVQQKISGEKNVPNIILKLEELATVAGIDLLSIKPAAEVSKGSYDSITIALEFESEYSQLVNFLSRWVDTPFYLAVEELTVTKAKDTSTKLHVDLKVNVLFKAKQEDPAVPADKRVKNE